MDDKELRDLWHQTIPEAPGWDQLNPEVTYRPPKSPTSPTPPPLPTVTLAGDKTLLRPGTAPPAPSFDGPTFDLMEEIGRGGMGIVFRARQASLRRDIAVKQILPEALDAEARARFVAEALVTGLLDHPNIVPVHDLARTAMGDILLAMKLVSGTSWKALLHPKTPAHQKLADGYDLQKHLALLLSVCNAVAFAHSKGIVHRDLKPENVMVGEFGEVLVMDWGIALDIRDHPQADARTQHKSGATVPAGTPSYMSPEQAAGRGADIGPWSDVYLLGSILLEVVTGKPPHRGVSIFEVLKAAVRAEPPALSDSVPSELAGIIRKSLARETRDRYQTVSQFQEALQDFAKHRESTLISTAAEEKLAHCETNRVTSNRNALYVDFAEAVAGFRQARLLWDCNEAAILGERRARQAYAAAALEGGDLGLAEAQGDPSLAPRIAEAKAARARTARNAKIMRLSLIGAAGLIIAGLAVGFGLVQEEQARTAMQRDNAELARIAATNERSRAEQREKEAIDARAHVEIEQKKTQDALGEAVTQKKRAQDEEGRARDEQRKAEEQKQIAQSQTKLAEEKAFEANDQRARAEAQKKAADEQRTAAESARKLAEEERKRALERLAFSHYLRGKLLGDSGEHGAAAALFAEANRVHPSIAYSAQALDHLAKSGTLIASSRDQVAAFAEDGTIVAVERCESVVVFSADTGKAVGSPVILPGQASAIAINATGTAFAIAFGPMVSRWSVEEARPIGGAINLAAAPYTLWLSPDGSVLTAVTSKSFECWNLARTQRLLFLNRESGYGTAEASDDGSLLAFSSDDGALRIVDLATGTVRGKPFQAGTGVMNVAFSHDLAAVALLQGSRYIQVWRVADGTAVGARIDAGAETASSLEFSPDGKSLWIRIDGNLERRDIVNGARIGDPLKNATILSGGRFAICFEGKADDRTFWFWDMDRNVKVGSDFRSTDAGSITQSAGRLIPSADSLRVAILAPTLDRTIAEIQSDVPLSSARFSADRRRVITLSTAVRRRRMNASDGTTIDWTPLAGFSGAMSEWTLSPDGRFVATVDGSKLRVYGSGSPDVIEHKGKIELVLFSPKSAFLITGDEEGLHCWNTATKRFLLLVKASSFDLALFERGGLAFSRDGTMLASSPVLDVITIWDLATCKAIKEFRTNDDSNAGHLEWSPGGDLVAARQPKQVVLYDRKTGTLKAACPVNDANHIAFRRDGQVVAISADDGTVSTWSVATGQRIGLAMQHTEKVESIRFDPSGRYLLCETPESGTVHLWDAISARRLAGFPCKSLVHAAVSASRTRLLLVGSDPDGSYGSRRTDLWQLPDESPRHIKAYRQGESSVRQVVYSPDGIFVAISGYDKIVHVSDAAKPNMTVASFTHSGGTEPAIAFSPDGTRVAVASTVVEVFSVYGQKQTGKTIQCGRADIVAFTPDGAHVMTAARYSADSVEWDWKTGESVKVLATEKSHDRIVAFSPSGKLFVRRRRGSVEIVDVASGKIVTSFPLRAWSLDHVSISADEARISYVDEGSLQMRSIPKGELLAAPMRIGDFSTIAFHPKLPIAASAPVAGTIRVWDAVIGERLIEVVSPLKVTGAMAFSPDGATVAMVYNGSYALLPIGDLLQPVDPAALLRRAQRVTGYQVDGAGHLEPMSTGEWESLPK